MKLRVNGVDFKYHHAPILKDVDLEVKPGEVLGLVGPNGSGKSTLIRCINAILKPQKGTIHLNGNTTDKMSLKELAQNIGYVPQSSANSFPLTVFEAVMLGRKPRVEWRLGEKDKQIVLDTLKMMKIDHMALRILNEMSGGEKQKVLIARAFCQEPCVMLLDEPTSNLDLKHQLETMSLVRDKVRENGLMAIVAIHDLNLAAHFADKIVMLKKGVIHRAGESRETLTPDNIQEVYGVKAEVIERQGKTYILPMGTVGE